MFGIGGAVITTPAIRVLGATTFQAIGSTLPSILPSSISGSLRYNREHFIRGRIVLITAAFGVPASVAGIAPVALRPRQRPLADDRDRGARRVHRVPHRVPDRTRPTARPARSTCSATNGGCSALIGVAAGALSGLLGVGGGILMVPAFSAWVGLPLKDTIATSLACVGIFAIPGHAHARVPRRHRLDVRDRARGRRRSRARRSAPGSRSPPTTGSCATPSAPRSASSRSIYARRRDQGAGLSSARAVEHRVEHLGREPAGERVLLARVERAEHRDAPALRPRAGARTADAGRGARAPSRASDRSADHTASYPKAPSATITRTRSSSSSSRARYGTHSSRSAGVGLFAGGAQRTAAATYASWSSSPSSTRGRRRLVGEAAAEQRREQEVARPVAGEHPAGAIAAVRRGREPDDQHPGAGVAETRHRPGPVRLVAKRRALLARDLFAPFDEPRARATLR